MGATLSTVREFSAREHINARYVEFASSHHLTMTKSERIPCLNLTIGLYPHVRLRQLTRRLHQSLTTFPVHFKIYSVSDSTGSTMWLPCSLNKIGDTQKRAKIS